MAILQRLFVATQHVLPHHLLSRVVYVVVRWPWRPWKNLLIQVIARAFSIDTSEARRAVPTGYRTFNDFFTRELVDGARPIAPHGRVASPCDGAISELGPIAGDRLLQAKGRHYRVGDLLGQPDAAEAFAGGQFITLYLAPYDYHRVHMPIAGRLLDTTYVPGRLFSVSPLTTRRIPDLFARNERLVCRFSTELGELAVVLVGAMLVSAIETVWDGELTRHRTIHRESWRESDVRLDRGAELGRFNMGSTVILLFPEGTVRWDAGLGPEHRVRMGQALGEIAGPAPANRPDSKRISAC